MGMRSSQVAGWLLLAALPVTAADPPVAPSPVAQAPTILLLPLIAGDGLGPSGPGLATALWALLDHSLIVTHPDQDWASGAACQLFADEAELRSYLAGRLPGLPPGAAQRPERYLLTGRVDQHGDAQRVALVLRDRQQQRQWQREAAVDAPGLVAPRQALLALLADAGLMVSPANRAAMLWAEALPAAALPLLGRGLLDYDLAAARGTGAESFRPQELEQALAQAPRSYLALNALGWLRWQQARPAEAEVLFAQAVAANPLGCNALDGWAECDAKAGRDAPGIEHAARAAELRGEQPTVAVVRRYWCQRAGFLAAAGDPAGTDTAYAAAIGTLERALAAQPAPVVTRALRLALADIRYEWADNLGDRARFAEAARNYLAAAEIDRELRPADAAVELHKVGWCYGRLGQYRQAIAQYEQALVVERQVGDRGSEGDTLHSLGLAYASVGELDRAFELYQQVLAIRRQLGDRSAEAKTLSALGLACEQVGRSAQAVAYHEQALVIRRAVRDRRGEGVTLNNLGISYASLAEFAKATSYYEQALVVEREVGDRASEAASLGGLGSVCASLSQDQRAAGHFEQAVALKQALQDRTGEAVLLAQLGSVERNLGRQQAALQHLEQALQIQRETDDKRGAAATLNSLALAYDDAGDNAKTLAAFQHAADLWREVGDLRGEAGTLYNLGNSMAKSGEAEAARRIQELALPLTREADYRAAEAAALGSLMRVWQALRNPGLAIFYGKLAVNTHQAIRRNLRGLDRELQRGYLKAHEETYRVLAQVLIEEGRLLEAQQVLDLRKEDDYVQFLHRGSPRAAALTAGAELSADEARWAARYAALGERCTALGADLATLHPLADSAPNEARRKAAGQVALAAVRAGYAACFRELAAAFAPSGPRSVAAAADGRRFGETLATLGHTVAVYTLITEATLHLVVYTADKQTAVRVPVPRDELNHRVALLRAALRSPTRDPRPAGKAVYDLLVAPVAGLLAGSQRVYWSLDGALRYVPVAALWDGDRYLVERAEHLVLTPAAKDKLLEPAVAPWRGLGLGSSRGHAEFAPLPGVVDELGAIIGAQGAMPGRVLLDEQFTLATLRAALSAPERPEVVHIATHFACRPGNDQDSYLVLGDGQPLTLAALQDMPQLLANCELVTLSACETAVGGGSGAEVDGLAMLAQYMGAKAVIASLWPVADRSTRRLMETFYRYRQAHPTLGKGEAFRQAQLALLRGTPGLGGDEPAERGATLATPAGPTLPAPAGATPYSHPFYWAPFIVIGNAR